jgi:hypothetical protein
LEVTNVAKSKKPAVGKSESKPKTAAKSGAKSTGEQLIDPGQSAAAAAAMVAHKLPSSAPAPSGAGEQPQSSTFAKLKESLNKPHAQTMGNLLDKLSTPGQKKSALPFAGGKQVGHNQTYGSDASRRNVPRRTGG